MNNMQFWQMAPIAATLPPPPPASLKGPSLYGFERCCGEAAVGAEWDETGP